MIAVLIPVLGRPQRVEPLVASLKACSLVIQCRPYFLCSPGDDAQIEAVRASQSLLSIMEWPAGQGDYARKMNWGVEVSDEPFMLFGADDVHFHPGWAERAVAAWYETGACVIGTNDLGNARVQRGQHSTHPLVHRDYLDCGTADEEGLLLHEGYVHQYVDDEFVQTAQVRRTFAFARDAHVEHLHPDWGKGEWDGTYQRGKDGFEHDRVLYNQRKNLWLRGRP